MTKQKLDQYAGSLNAAQIAAGMNAAASNAKRLLGDAKILLKSNRFPTAASLAVLAIEEAGKVSILRGLSVAKDAKEIRSRWRDYRSHTKKNVAWILPDLVAQGARSLDALKPIFHEESDHPYVLEQVKQLGFYTDCLGKAHWSIPDEVIDEQLARMLVATAEIFVRDREVTVEEIELWIEHIGPVWNGPREWMKKALVNWYRAAQDRGFVPPGKNDMEKFVTKGIDRG